jgi:hypothetical protein
LSCSSSSRRLFLDAASEPTAGITVPMTVPTACGFLYFTTPPDVVTSFLRPKMKLLRHASPPVAS